jgi:ABC-type multidrug transport system ATPase subunit
VAADNLAVETNDLSLSFGAEKALDGLSFEVEAGEVVALLGPNGAGKTTTVRLLNGILTPDAGRSRVLGLDPATDGDALRRRTGVMTEQSGLDERLTALENVVFTARMRGLSSTAATTQASTLLERFGIAGRRHDRVQGFSTGQRKRVALARAIALDPHVILYDEPTTGLDPVRADVINQLIIKLKNELKVTSITVTHDMASAFKIADRIVMLHEGKIIFDGTPEEIQKTDNALVHQFVVGEASETELAALDGAEEQAKVGGAADKDSG